MLDEYQVEGNVLSFRLTGPEEIDMSLFRERLEELKAQWEEVHGEIRVKYESDGKAGLYVFRNTSQGYEVEGRVEYPEEIKDAERAFESQRRLMREYYLRFCLSSTEEGEERKEEREGGKMEGRRMSIRDRIVEAARKLYEEKGKPPTAREITQALGYKSPRVLYGPDRFSSLSEIYEAAGIKEEVRPPPGAAVPKEIPPPTEVRGYELVARVVGNQVLKDVETDILGSKLRTTMSFPLTEPLKVGGPDVLVKIVPGPKLTVEIWKKKPSRRGRPRKRG